MQRLGGDRAHFHLYRDQFSSDSQTAWDGRLLKCNEAVNFFVWPSDVWKLRFWTIFKKVWQKMDSWGRRFSPKKTFKKFKKMMKIFFFIFVFIMFYWMYYVPQTWFNDPKPILHPLYSQIIRQSLFQNYSNITKTHSIKKFFDIFWTFWWFV